MSASSTLFRSTTGISLLRYFYPTCAPATRRRACRRQDHEAARGRYPGGARRKFSLIADQNRKIVGRAPSLNSLTQSKALSVALEKPTPQKYSETLVKEIIHAVISDRQSEECPGDLLRTESIVDRFRFTLSSMLHSRIAYPKSGQEPWRATGRNLAPDVMAATRKPETAPPVSAARTECVAAVNWSTKKC